MQRFLPMISAEGSSRQKGRSCLRFKCSSVHELKAVKRRPVHELSAVNDHSLRFKYSATARFWTRRAVGDALKRPVRVGLEPGDLGGWPDVRYLVSGPDMRFSASGG